ncbi:Peroxin 19-1, partial [Globisporangium splendens]
MDAVAIHTSSSALSVEALQIDGDLVFEQRKPLHLTQRTPNAIVRTSTYANILGPAASFGLTRRPLDAAYFQTPYPVWTTDVSRPGVITSRPRQFRTKMVIQIPTIDVLSSSQIAYLLQLKTVYDVSQKYRHKKPRSPENFNTVNQNVGVYRFAVPVFYRSAFPFKDSDPSSQFRIRHDRQARTNSMSSNADDDHKQEEEIDLDDLLDGTDRSYSLEVAKVRDEAESTLKASEENEMEQLKESMSKFLEDAQNPEFQQVLEQAFRELGTSADGENIESLLGSLSAKSGGGGNGDDDDDVSIGVAKTLQNMAKAAEDMEGMESAKLEEMGEEMMEEMMKKFESMGEKSDFQDLVDGMMQQLLSKDVMYDPMKQICERYPEWLAEKESLLSKEDYERYGKQYQYFQQIIAVYESEPDNFPRLSELMQEMQETGQPPSEIVKDLAPGLQFDDEGMPIMPNMVKWLGFARHGDAYVFLAEP